MGTNSTANFQGSCGTSCCNIEHVEQAAYEHSWVEISFSFNYPLPQIDQALFTDLHNISLTGCN